MLTDHEFITPFEKTRCQVHLTFEKVQTTRKSSQEALSDRDHFSLEHQQGLGKNEPQFRFSNPEIFMKSFLEEHEDYMVAEAKSEVRKRGCRADFLDSSVRNIKITCSQRQNLKCESEDAEQIFATVLFVIFRDNIIPIVWKSIVPIKAMKNLEKSKPGFMKNQLSEREYFEKLTSEVFMNWEN